VRIAVVIAATASACYYLSGNGNKRKGGQIDYN